MKSRPGIFISLVVAIATVSVGLGLFVIKDNQRKQPYVQQQDRLYAAQQVQADQPQLPSGSKSSSPQPQTKAEVAEAQPDQNQPTTQLYFSKNPDSDNDPNAVFGVDRNINDNTAADVAAIQALIAGPTQDEVAAGYYGGIQLSGKSDCGDKDFQLSIDDNQIKLQFCRQHISGGSIQDIKEKAQIVYTLRQFNSTAKIIILDQTGNCLLEASGLNSCLQ